MDIILIILLVILILLGYLLISEYTPKNKKKWVYYALLFINSVLLVILNKNLLNKNEKFSNRQTGGKLTKRQKLLAKCGLSENDPSVNHCFADGTHHTCCMLGHKARKGSDATGNPIGSASKKSFKISYRREPNNNDKTGWCTCLGSKVCSEYAKSYGDGTHIKFINNPLSSTEIVENVSPQCEAHYREKFGISSHLTPGIKAKNSLSKSKSAMCNKSQVINI